MFQDGFDTAAEAGAAGPVGAPLSGTVPTRVGALGVSSAGVATMRETLGRLDPAVAVPTDRATAGPEEGGQAAPGVHPHTGPGLTERQCIDLLRELEDLKSAAAGAQAVVTAHLARERTAAEQSAGVPAHERRQGLAGEVALARRVSPHRGGQHLGLAMTLATDMPHTLSALRRGRLSEWRATLLVRESICLESADRRALDAEMCSDPDRYSAWGDKRMVAEARKVAYRLDPHSVAGRAARAEQERCVSIRPAPDTMAYLTALLPMRQAVAAHAALKAAADSARSCGDARSRGQVMADTLVSCVTGRDPAHPADLKIHLVMSDRSLLAGGDEPADLPGYGPVPSDWARELVRRALAEGGDTGVWVHRLFTNRANRLVAMESRGRTAPPGLAEYLGLRDGGICRTPYCDAPIRHTDHVVPVRAGGATHAQNLQGQCERCNYTKDLAGWRAVTAPRAGPSRGGDAPQEDPAGRPDAPRGDPSERRGPPPADGSRRRDAPRGDPPASRHQAPPPGPPVITTTPTGHSYRSAPPALPRVG